MSSVSGPIIKKFLLDSTLSEIDKLDSQEFVFNMMLEEVYEAFGFDEGGRYTVEEIKKELILLSIKREELKSKYLKYLE